MVSDVVVAWPMCRHVSNVGRRKVHLDSVASQVVDILPFVQQFCKYLVIYENVSNLVVLDEVISTSTDTAHTSYIGFC